MYSQSAKANNQTDTSKSKRGEFKTTGTIKTLIKREFNLALRTTQTAFQCFSVFFLPVIMAVVFSILWNKTLAMPDDGVLVTDPANVFFIVCGVLTAMLPSVCNAAITSFSREGAAVSSLKVLPIDGKTVVKSKMIAWGIPAVISAVVAVTVANAFSFQIVRFILSLVAYAALTVSLTLFGVLWDLNAPKLGWNNPIEAVKGNTHANIGMFISMGGGFAVLIAAFVMFFFNVGAVAFNAIYWVIILVESGIFIAVDAVLYKNANAAYNRIEL